ncbi:MAG: cryptochrome/photolyase family protein [Planctomycetota bacterium]
MGAFLEQLHAASTHAHRLPRAGSDGRRWVYAPYDQLSDRFGPLAHHAPEEVGLVLVECPDKAARRPYHRRKLAFVLAAQRRFALEQAQRGVAVRYEVAPEGEGFAAPLARVAAEVGSLAVMEPAEHELREELAPLIADGRLDVLPHAGWLTTAQDFRAAVGPRPPWRMDRFYRHVRRRTGTLLDGDGPAGGKWSFDAENRKPWRGTPPAPRPPAFVHGPVEREVQALVRARFGAHPGDERLEGLATTRADALRAWQWFLAECLPHFGAYEDAMSAGEVGLFHARIATYLNVHLLTPREVVADVVASDAPLAAREGFVRQVLGWREFVRHVHAASNGLRDLPQNELRAGRPLPQAFWLGARATETEHAAHPGAAAGRSDVAAEPQEVSRHGPLAAPRSDARERGASSRAPWRELPGAWDGAPAPTSGLACLDTVTARVWREGYSHHIERLMVLSNLATLLDVTPRQLTDWFWVAYTDAYDWVVEPNVLGMGTPALGDAMVTKPYVSGAAYLARMGDFCGACAFDPKRDCPVTDLYWAFLARHRGAFAQNPRLALPLGSLQKREPERRTADARVFEWVSAELTAGRPVEPAGVRLAREGE